MCVWRLDSNVKGAQETGPARRIGFSFGEEGGLGRASCQVTCVGVKDLKQDLGSLLDSETDFG